MTLAGVATLAVIVLAIQSDLNRTSEVRAGAELREAITRRLEERKGWLRTHRAVWRGFDTELFRALVTQDQLVVHLAWWEGQLTLRRNKAGALEINGGDDEVAEGYVVNTPILIPVALSTSLFEEGGQSAGGVGRAYAYDSPMSPGLDVVLSRDCYETLEGHLREVFGVGEGSHSPIVGLRLRVPGEGGGDAAWSRVSQDVDASIEFVIDSVTIYARGTRSGAPDWLMFQHPERSLAG